ncbi:MAG: hypothetical protein ACRDXX_04330 [Stackebrandtia sp.]
MGGYIPRNLRKRGGGAATREREERDKTEVAAPKKSKPKSKTKTHTPQRGRPSPGPGRGGSGGGRPKRKTSFKRRLRRMFSRSRRRNRSIDWRRLAMVLGPLAVVFALAAGYAWYAAQTVNTPDRADAAAKGAEVAARALFAYDYRDFDASVANGVSHATGAFAEDYKEEAEGLRETVEAEDAEITVTVAAVAVIEADVEYKDDSGHTYEHAVEVLAFMDQVVNNANIEGPRTDSNRVALTMVDVDGEWKAANARAF